MAAVRRGQGKGGRGGQESQDQGQLYHPTPETRVLQAHRSCQKEQLNEIISQRGLKNWRLLKIFYFFVLIHPIKSGHQWHILKCLPSTSEILLCFVLTIVWSSFGPRFIVFNVEYGRSSLVSSWEMSDSSLPLKSQDICPRAGLPEWGLLTRRSPRHKETPRPVAPSLSWAVHLLPCQDSTRTLLRISGITS